MRQRANNRTQRALRAISGAVYPRGSVMIEMLVSSLVALVIGCALLALIQVDVSNQGVTLGQGNTDNQVRRPLDILADNIRNAQLYPAGSSTGSCLQGASATSITCYMLDTTVTPNTVDGSRTQFWLDTSVSPWVLKKTVTIAPTNTATTTSLVSGVTSLTLTYYKVPSGQYSPSASSWTTTTNPNLPTAAELPYVAAVSISAQVTVNGYTRTLSTLVRIRSAPAH